MGLLAIVVLGIDLGSEPHFMDESAYLSQSFYADLFIDGKRDDPAWLDYAGYDLPPLPKYLIGLALRVEGFRRPPPSAMWAWYANPGRRFGSPGALTAARRPSVLLGAVGCVAILGLGTLGFNRRVGWVAALLLLGNPLYRMHARRAMSDVPAEALILASLAVGLWAWRRFLTGRSTLATTSLFTLAGILAGLATLAKLNGALAVMILASWAVLALALGRFPLGTRVRIAILTAAAGLVAFATFAGLNPFLTARPTGPVEPRLASVARMTFAERVRAVADHRVAVSARANEQFPRDALTTMGAKLVAVAVQGFGRFGPFGPRGRTDSTVRLDPMQDRGAWVWLPWVAVGFGVALARGRAQLRAGEPPTAWAIAAQSAVALVVVTAFIPLAWDRYFLSIQPGSALLGACALVAGCDRLGRWVKSGPNPVEASR